MLFVAHALSLQMMTYTLSSYFSSCFNGFSSHHATIWQHRPTWTKLLPFHFLDLWKLTSVNVSMASIVSPMNASAWSPNCFFMTCDQQMTTFERLFWGHIQIDLRMMVEFRIILPSLSIGQDWTRHRSKFAMNCVKSGPTGSAIWYLFDLNTSKAQNCSYESGVNPTFPAHAIRYLYRNLLSHPFPSTSFYAMIAALGCLRSTCSFRYSHSETVFR